MKKKIILLGILMFCIHALQAQGPISNKSWETRSAVSQALGQSADASAFYGYNEFYIGTAAENAEKSLSTVVLQRKSDETTYGWEVVFNGLVPDLGIKVNDVDGQPSNFNNSIINNVAATPNLQNVIVTKPVPAEIPDTGGQTYNTIGWIDPINKTELTNFDNKILDGIGTELKEQPIAKAAASIDTVFVAVPVSGGVFGAAGSGLVRLKKDTTPANGLKVQRLDTSEEGDFAYGIDLLAFKNPGEYKPDHRVVQFSITAEDAVNFTLGSVVDLFWDEPLKRIYVAFTNTTCEEDHVAGACSLLVGYVNDKNQLFLQTTIPLSVVSVLDSMTDMIGYKSNHANTTTVSTFKARTMHTSTGKVYIITNGDVSAVDMSETEPDLEAYKKTQVNTYALPLVFGIPNDANIGLIANENANNTIDFATPVDSYDTMMSKTKDKIRVTVGSDIHYLCHSDTANALKDAAIQDMQIIGDTVYVAVAGSRGAVGADTNAAEAGIFSSTAIFSENAEIRAWTPWQRVMGCTDKVFYFGLDKYSSKYWYITQAEQATAEPNKQIAKVTMWDSGDASVDGVHAGSPLINALQPKFNDGYGLTCLANFDDETVGFKTWNLDQNNKAAPEYPAFSMMVAGGLGKIALIQTGVRNADKIFVPTQKFEANTIDVDTIKNVFIFDNSVTQQLGFVTCAEVSRIATTNTSPRENNLNLKGWLFVGGENGIVVMVATGGNGWDTKNGLALLGSGINDYPGKSYAFVTLTPPTGYSFTNIRKLVSDGKYLYILTKSDLYRLEMDASTFTSGTSISEDKMAHLASIDDKFKNASGVVMSKYLDEFFDLMVINDTSNAKVLAIGTSQGLWISNTILDNFVPENLTWNRNINTDGISELPLGPALKFNFLSTLRGGKFNSTSKSADGNLYLTAIDPEFNDINVYRFNVNNGTVRLFLEPYKYSKETMETTPYFYSLADISGLNSVEFTGPLDYIATKDQITEDLEITPDPNKFLPNGGYTNGYFPAINLGLNPQAALHTVTITQDTASGAVYIPGNFIVFVNE